MAWEEGKSGNPAGRPKDSKIWQDAIKRALTRKGKNKSYDFAGIDKVADAVIEAAISGDMVAAKEIGDRLDGKATNFLVVENRTAFDDMPLDELSKRDKAIAERIERLQALSQPSSGEAEAGSVPAIH